jgi:hypothetical protein
MIHPSLIACLSDDRVKTDELYRVEKAKGKNPQNANFLETYGERYGRGPQALATPPVNPNPRRVPSGHS